MTRPGSDLNAWCDYPPVSVPHPSTGPLAGKTLAVKDIMQVAGYPNGWGSPTRLAEAQPDTETQSAVQKLVDAGAEILGKAQCEELCFSLAGNNAHYGMPVNGAAPDRLSGGSSSGSVSLVSNGIVDIATGSDTGGSVRGPASFCGLLGLRTTHGRIPLDRTMPLAPSFDCFGWFTRDVADYPKIGEILLGDDASETALSRIVGCAELDGFLLDEDECVAFAPAVKRVEDHFGKGRSMVPLGFNIETAYWTFRNVQAWESWESLGGWITQKQPALGPGVKERFEYGRDLPRTEFEKSSADRVDLTAQIEALIGDDGLLVYPTVPSCARLRTISHDGMQEFRERGLRLMCISGREWSTANHSPAGRSPRSPDGT